MHYLVAVDHTEATEKVLEKALQVMSKERGDHITVVHAVTVGVVCSFYYCSFILSFFLFYIIYI